MKDYSQWGEQQAILRYFGDFVGNFLDVGAFDGETGSNSRALALLGWSGVCIEPDPESVLHLLKLYSNNDKISILNAALVPGWCQVHPFYGLSGQRSTVLPERSWENNQPFYVTGVDPILVHSYFKQRFDFVSLDVEGMEFELLKVMHPLLIGTKLLCIEDTQRVDDKTKSEIEEYLPRIGFTKLVQRSIDKDNVYSNWIVARE